MISKIETRIRTYEIAGKEITGLHKDSDDLIVEAHWNQNRLVLLEFQGKQITVDADDLKRAIQNATNHGI